MAKLGDERRVRFATIHQAEDNRSCDYEPYDRCPYPGDSRAKVTAQDPPVSRAEGCAKDESEHTTEDELG